MTPLPQRSPAEALREAAEHRAAGRQPVLLDVREPWEVRHAAVTDPVFVHLRVPMQQVPAALAGLDPAGPIYVLCHHGMRSLQVALFLQSQGCVDVCNVAGGIDAWSRDADHSIRTY